MRIACVLIPRFPLALEVMGRSELRGLPLVLGGAPEERKVVVECSIAAEREGVSRGMPLRAALTLCRDAVFLEAHPGRYADTFERMLDALEEVSPIIEGAERGCAYLDLTGLEGVGTELGERHLAAAMQRATKGAVGLTPHVGIADTRFAAWTAASALAEVRRSGFGVAGAVETGRRTRDAEHGTPNAVAIIPSGEAAAFLAPLPVERLPLSDEMRRRLRWLGLRTAGELATLPRGKITAQFGPEGAVAWNLACGEGGGPLVPRRPPLDISDQIEFTWPTVDAGALLAAARRLLSRLLRLPACAGRAVRGISLSAVLGGGHRWQRTLTFREPTGDRERMLRTIAVALDGAVFPAAVEALALGLRDPCGESGVQGGLFSGHARSRHGLETALAQLGARFGRPLIMQLMEVEPWSRFPERRYALAAMQAV